MIEVYYICKLCHQEFTEDTASGHLAGDHNVGYQSTYELEQQVLRNFWIRERENYG